MTIKTENMQNQKNDIQQALPKIEYRVARTRDELEKAYHLVYKEYLKKKYTEETKAQIRLSEHNALPSTTTFIAKTEDQVLATVTIIPDSPLGIPMDKIYNEELSELRKNNKKICEISMLATNPELFGKGMATMLNSKKLFFVFFLFKLVFDYARDILKLDYLCITINPKHQLTYDFLLFRNLGELKSYEHANGAPAIAKYLDLHSVEQECNDKRKIGIQKMFFKRKSKDEQFSNKIILTEEDLKYFFIDKTNIFKEIPIQNLDAIKKSYPGYDFSRILT